MKSARSALLLAPAISLACLFGCDGAEPSGRTDSPWFVDATSATGLDFDHESGLDGSFFYPEVIGSGGALFDYDLDGDLDVYLVNGGPHERDAPETARGRPNRLFRRENDGRYSDVTGISGTGDSGYGMGAAVGDMDNDGDLDLYVTNYGRDALYRNEGDGTFTDVTSRAGLGTERWSTSAGFCDHDGDGHLDLYVVTYVEHDPSRACADDGGRPEYCAPSEYRPVADVLYRNDGDGTFTDVSVRAGIAASPNRGLGLACSDLDGDGLTDYFVANDGERNQLWMNLGHGRFEDRGVVAGTAVNLFGKPEASMGVALGDVDGDLELDLFLTHLDRETNTLYTNLGGGAFRDGTALSGLGPSSLAHTGFGTDFFDADQDGDLDLAVVCGRVTRAKTSGDIAILEPGSSPHDRRSRYREGYGEPNLFFVNDSAGSFREACPAAAPFCDANAVARGLMVGDVDGDGDQDLLVTHSNAPAALFVNEIRDPGHWVVVRAIDAALNRDAVGATVRIVAGGTEQIRPVTHTRSYLSSTDASVHFGLGSAGMVDGFVVRWPDGESERFDGEAADRYIELVRGTGDPLSTGQRR